MPNTSATPALGDITVLDLSHALAGPFASSMLGDYGANIIKIESPDGGDMGRHWGPPFYGTESAYFVSLNRNKRSVHIDLKHPEGKELFLRLAERADVVLENLRLGTVGKLGIDYERTRARKPDIIYCSISGFGQDGPYRHRAALDLVVQAESGLMSLTGEPGGRGVRCGISIADIAAGMYAAYGIMTALFARARTGRGQFLDVSMLEGQLGILQIPLGTYLANGVVPQPMGTAYATIIPYQTFRTKTRDLALGIGSEKAWQALCPLLGLEAIANDPRFVTNKARNLHRPLILGILQEAFLTKTYDEWEALLVPAGIPVGPINTLEDVVHHPQVKARNALVECEHPTAGNVKVVAPVVRMSETPGGVRMAAPLPGQHTDEVLREQLGLDATELLRLRRAGAIGSVDTRSAATT
jgi:crotonobetainyl-CoA:carnitine CoA-transferase CaiB-like acyl-CoA transferase